MNTIKIGEKCIGEGYPCFIIAEIGTNHNQQFAVAKKLIDYCIEAGVDAVKFQSFTVDNWLSKDFIQFPTMKGSTNLKEMLRTAELSHKLYMQIAEYCKQQNIICFSTPSHIVDVDLLNSIGTPAFKFGSVQITDLPTIKYAAHYNIPIILSAGASYMSEVCRAVETIQRSGNEQIALLHCTSIYPCEDYSLLNLNVIKTFQTMFKYPIGYSDHTTDPLNIPIAAVAMGAKIIEKHVTINKNMEGPDHRFALEPNEIKKMVKAIRNIERAFGSSYRYLLAEENEVARMGRRSLVSTRDIKKGEIITEKDLTIKRPGYGIEPGFINKIIGRVACQDIECDRVITWEMI